MSTISNTDKQYKNLSLNDAICVKRLQAQFETGQVRLALYDRILNKDNYIRTGYVYIFQVNREGKMNPKYI